MNLIEILKYAPKGTPLYSPLCGECTLDYVFCYLDVRGKYPICVITPQNKILNFDQDGYWDGYENGECLLFPSRENRDWNKFALENKIGSFVLYSDKENPEIYDLHFGIYKGWHHVDTGTGIFEFPTIVPFRFDKTPNEILQNRL